MSDDVIQSQNSELSDVSGWLVGCPVSEELEVGSLSGTDSFLVSVPLNGQAVSRFYRSMRVSYDTLRDDIYDALFGDIGLGTMATHDEDEYERQPHHHFGRYSMLSVEQFVKRDPDIEDEEQDSVIVLGHIVVDGTSYDICVPKADQTQMNKFLPKIGTLKFLALPRMQDIDENSQDFDGWTFPDGRALSKYRFPDAYEVFGDEYTHDTSNEAMFNLPVLSDFLEMNPGV